MQDPPPGSSGTAVLDESDAGVVQTLPASPNAQYVVLQMYTGGQNFVAGHSIRVYDAAGTPIGTFTFAASVANGATQAKILIATSEAAAFFGVSADLTMTPVIPAAGGKVCFSDPTDSFVIDCASWGSYSGPSGGPFFTGTPFHAAGGITAGQAMVRRLDIAAEFAERTADKLNPVRLIDTALGPLASQRTRQAIGFAGSRQQALTLLLLAPEFQRR